MKWGKVVNVEGDSVIVDTGNTHRKPMRLPRGAQAEAGDVVLVDNSTGTHIIVSVYSQKEVQNGQQ